MARQARTNGSSTGQTVTVFDPGVANPKQKLFYSSRTLFTAYGGAKGGGKTHAVRIQAVVGALRNDGIKILIMRATYKDLTRNHIRPILVMLSQLPDKLYSYNNQEHIITFQNGSTIEFGHWQGEASEREYNGIEYDWIFMDEATQFSERAFRLMCACLRGDNGIPKRMYLTCNPGGVGHRWVKRLFVDKIYDTDNKDPEARENPADYTFIPATVEDNPHAGSQYVKLLATLPDDIKKAYRYGDWNALGGNYFPEFTKSSHVRQEFSIPKNWTRYRSFDYGLDKLACYWFAVDEDGRSWCYKEVTAKGKIVQEASKLIHDATLWSEKIQTTYAPPDMWSRQKDTGKTMAECFMQNGILLTKSDNNRVQGHMAIKDMLAPAPLNDPYVKKMYGDRVPQTLPMLMFFPNCKEIIGDIQDIQSSEDDPNDCAKEPHEITHTVDGLRYFAVMRTLSAEAEKAKQTEDDFETGEDYEDFMCGGEATSAYIGYGGENVS